MSKLRTDSWAANLTEEQAWALYYKARGLKWNEAAAWAVKEFGVDAPSRTAFYAWLGRMRKEESAHRLEQAATAAAEAAALAKKTANDDALIGAYKAMAAELALRTGSAKEAQRFVEMAATIADRRQKAEKLKLDAARQRTADEQLKLAREKFMAAERRENAAKGTLADEKLTPEEKLKELDRLFGR